MLAKMQKNWISHTFLVGIQKGIVTSENSLVIIYKTKHILTNYILGHSSWRIENLCPCKYLYVNVNSRLLGDNKDTENNPNDFL